VLKRKLKHNSHQGISQAHIGLYTGPNRGILYRALWQSVKHGARSGDV